MLARTVAVSAAAGAGAVQAAPQQQPPAMEAAVVRHHDERVDHALAAQITDPSSPMLGGVPDTFGLLQAHPAGMLVNSFIAAYLCPQSRHYHQNLLVDRIRLAARFLEGRLSPDGNVDLVITNFNSPPDTGFVILTTTEAASVARRYGANEMVALLEPFLKRAGEGLVKGGVHTPNHRWVVSAAMARLNDLFPDPRYVRRVDQWLAEGVDIDDDGHYTERSTTIYSGTCNQCFTLLADKLKRPELLDPVRRNLTATAYLLHPDSEVVTEISRRQDQYQRAGLERHWFALRYLAVHDSSGLFSGMEAQVPRAGVSLATLLDYPELAGPLPTPIAAPDNYEKRLAYALRIRRGPTSITLLPNNNRFLNLHRGAAVIEAVRFASAFFGRGQFQGRALDGEKGRYRLEQQLEGGYFQPLDPPRRVAAGEMRHTGRRMTEICRLTQSAEFAEKTGRGDGAFTLRLAAHGTVGVPVAVEIALRPGGVLEGCEPVRDAAVPAAAADAGQAWLLRNGATASYRVGADSIRFGPGLKAHTYIGVRGAQSRISTSTVYITGFTPFDHTIEFGWS
jgi:hypothetical protein